MKLPKFTQEAILHIDSTPDKDYPLRILRAYRENCNVKWSSSAGEEKTTTNPLLIKMNQDCDERARILDKAIKILNKENIK